MQQMLVQMFFLCSLCLLLPFVMFVPYFCVQSLHKIVEVVIAFLNVFDLLSIRMLLVVLVPILDVLV